MIWYGCDPANWRASFPKRKSSRFDITPVRRARRDTAGHYGDVVAAVATAFNAAVMAWIAASPS
jgi:hypothetical protein